MADKESQERKIEAKEQEKIEEDKQNLLKMSEISIWLDSYDDIFSDFDPRGYSQRSLSDDFLAEAKKASRDKDPSRLELRLLLPEDKRDSKNEAVIRKRLHVHFNKHAHLLFEEIRNERNKSIMGAFFGIVMMFGAAYVDYLQLSQFATRFLFVLLEPAGWFVTWFSLDRLFYASQLKKTEYKFYEKMSKCEIIFSSY